MENLTEQIKFCEKDKINKIVYYRQQYINNGNFNLIVNINRKYGNMNRLEQY